MQLDFALPSWVPILDIQVSEVHRGGLFEINHEATELQLSRLLVVTQGFGLPLRFTSFDSENAETFHRGFFFDVILKGWPIKDLLLLFGWFIAVRNKYNTSRSR